MVSAKQILGTAQLGHTFEDVEPSLYFEKVWDGDQIVAIHRTESKNHMGALNKYEIRDLQPTSKQ